MAAAQESSGSVTTDGTEQTINTSTTGKTFVFCLDTGNMAKGDRIELKVKTKCRTGDTSRIAYYALYQGVQGEPNKYSIPTPAPHEHVVTIKRLAGTDRAYPWAIYTLD